MNWGMISYESPRPLPEHVQRPAARRARPRRPGASLRPLSERRVHVAGARAAVARRYAAAGTKLDFGKSCLRFRALAGIELDVVGDIIASVTPEQFIAAYEASRSS